MRKRNFDSGEPLLLWADGDSASVGFAVDIAVCDNPSCTCTDSWLRAHRVRRLDESRAEVDVTRFEGKVSLEPFHVQIDVDPTGTLASDAAWLREKLCEESNRAWLLERRRRLRGQVGDPASPPDVPLVDPGVLVSFWEVFPYEFDLVIARAGGTYVAEDQYCIEPACTCEETVVQFIDFSKPGKGIPVGEARADLGKRPRVKTSGSSLVAPLWNELMEQHGIAELRRRFRRMRAFAKTRTPAPTRAARPSVGRNEPCPCGSGRKYKRCCGA